MLIGTVQMMSWCGSVCVGVGVLGLTQIFGLALQLGRLTEGKVVVFKGQWLPRARQLHGLQFASAQEHKKHGVCVRWRTNEHGVCCANKQTWCVCVV